MSKPKHPTSRRPLALVLGLLVASVAGGCGGCEEKPPETAPDATDAETAERDPGVDREKAADEADEQAVSLALSVNDDARYLAGNLEAENTPDEPAPDPQPNIANKPRETNGSIKTAELQKVFGKYSAQAQKCYERALKKDPNLAGRLFLSITISTDGSVASVDAQPDTLRSDEVNQCLEQLAEGWSFPKPTGGAAKVRKPYSFSPKQ